VWRPLIGPQLGPYFFAFDLLSVDGEDLRAKPLLERKRRRKRIMPRIASRLLYVEHVQERGAALFRAACRRDLEGIVVKWMRGPYHGGRRAYVVAENQESGLFATDRQARAVQAAPRSNDAQPAWVGGAGAAAARRGKSVANEAPTEHPPLGHAESDETDKDTLH